MTRPVPLERHHVFLADEAAAAGDRVVVPRQLVKDTDVPAVIRRLDSIDEELLLAEMSLYELVRHLEPVLPIGFGQDTVPPRGHRDVDGESPLAGRLTDMAGRTHQLVEQLKVIVTAVDL